MNAHDVFYYPYAQFSDEQLPLLKALVLYFDKIYILDPNKATRESIGIGSQEVNDAVKLLEDEKDRILYRIPPEKVLKKYEKAISEAIESESRDPEFVRLCEENSEYDSWLLALEKIPKKLRDKSKYKPLDEPMQRLLGELPRRVAPDLERYSERYLETTIGLIYDEGLVRSGNIEEREYRFAHYPVSLGESIMVNHALFGGLMQHNATPITDNTFHHMALQYKYKKVFETKEYKDVLKDMATRQKIKEDQLALKTLTDFRLPAISPKVPLEKILKFRKKHGDQLKQARDSLGGFAKLITDNPWTKDFEDEIKYKTVPSIQEILKKTKKARDSWLGAVGLSLTTGSAAISLGCNVAPWVPVPVVAGILGLVGGSVIPAYTLVRDWRERKKDAFKNGLSYLIHFK